MQHQSVVSFTNKDLVVTLAIIILLAIISLLQVIIMWLTDLQFSLHLINYKHLGKTNLKIISTVIIFSIKGFLVFAISKVFKIKVQKMFFKNDLFFILILIIIFTTYFLSPNHIPVNFATPIIFLFAFVIYKFRF